MARVLGVSTSGYYACLKRPRSAREKRSWPTAPDRLWVADITYVPTLAGFLYPDGTALSMGSVGI